MVLVGGMDVPNHLRHRPWSLPVPAEIPGTDRLALLSQILPIHTGLAPLCQIARLIIKAAQAAAHVGGAVAGVLLRSTGPTGSNTGHRRVVGESARTATAGVIGYPATGAGATRSDISATLTGLCAGSARLSRGATAHLTGAGAAAPRGRPHVGHR